jgi:hypothetical protein
VYPKIIVIESSKKNKNALIEWLRKETTKYFTKTKKYVVSLILSLVFKTVFAIFLAHLHSGKNYEVSSQNSDYLEVKLLKI